MEVLGELLFLKLGLEHGLRERNYGIELWGETFPTVRGGDWPYYSGRMVSGTVGHTWHLKAGSGRVT